MAEQTWWLSRYRNAIVLILLKNPPGIIDFLSFQFFFCSVLFLENVQNLQTMCLATLLKSQAYYLTKHNQRLCEQTRELDKPM